MAAWTALGAWRQNGGSAHQRGMRESGDHQLKIWREKQSRKRALLHQHEDWQSGDAQWRNQRQTNERKMAASSEGVAKACEINIRTKEKLNSGQAADESDQWQSWRWR